MLGILTQLVRSFRIRRLRHKGVKMMRAIFKKRLCEQLRTTSKTTKRPRRKVFIRTAASRALETYTVYKLNGTILEFDIDGLNSRRLFVNRLKSPFSWPRRVQQFGDKKARHIV